MHLKSEKINYKINYSTMAEYQFFVVFHKKIFDECYEIFPEDILYKYFTFIAVNQKIEKNYTQKYKVINEWELPIYDKSFQERGYNENSAFYHIYINNLHKPYKYIGFFQYDMIFNTNIIDFLNKNIVEPTLFSYTFHDCINGFREKNTLDFIIKDYEEFYNKPFLYKKIPLYNTYIIPIENYENIMGWVTQLYDKLYPWAFRYPNQSHFGHVGGIYERIMGFSLIGQCLKEVSIENHVSHDHKYKRLCN